MPTSAVFQAFFPKLWKGSCFTQQVYMPSQSASSKNTGRNSASRSSPLLSSRWGGNVPRLHLSVPQPRILVTASQSPSSSTRAVRVRLVVDKVVLEQVSFQVPPYSYANYHSHDAPFSRPLSGADTTGPLPTKVPRNCVWPNHREQKWIHLYLGWSHIVNRLVFGYPDGSFEFRSDSRCKTLKKSPFT
jgi:hypothetical protein